MTFLLSELKIETIFKCVLIQFMFLPNLYSIFKILWLHKKEKATAQKTYVTIMPDHQQFFKVYKNQSKTTFFARISTWNELITWLNVKTIFVM